jgi:hypothetical protein
VLSSNRTDDDEEEEDDEDDEDDNAMYADDDDVDDDISEHVLRLPPAERAAFYRLSPAEQRTWQELAEKAAVRE